MKALIHVMNVWGENHANQNRKELKSAATDTFMTSIRAPMTTNIPNNAQFD